MKQDRINNLAMKLVRVVNAIAEGEPSDIGAAALLSATATLMARWAGEGCQGPMLVSASDFLLSAAERYAVGEPMHGFFQHLDDKK
jgi:hypothetical protein